MFSLKIHDEVFSCLHTVDGAVSIYDNDHHKQKESDECTTSLFCNVSCEVSTEPIEFHTYIVNIPTHPWTYQVP